MFPQQNTLAPHTTGHPSDPPPDSESATERSPLLGARSELLPAHTSARSTSPSQSPPTNRRRSTWHDTFTARSLKKKSSALSDRISGRNHSSANLWALGPGGLGLHDESTEGEGDDEEDAVGGNGGLRRRKGDKHLKGAGYDGEFKAELEGEFGNGLRQVSRNRRERQTEPVS